MGMGYLQTWKTLYRDITILRYAYILAFCNLCAKFKQDDQII